MTCVRQWRSFKSQVSERPKQYEQLIASLANVRTVEEGTGLDTCSFLGRPLNTCPYSEWQVWSVVSIGDIAMSTQHVQNRSGSIGIGSSPHKLTAREHEVMT